MLRHNVKRHNLALGLTTTFAETFAAGLVSHEMSPSSLRTEAVLWITMKRGVRAPPWIGLLTRKLALRCSSQDN